MEAGRSSSERPPAPQATARSRACWYSASPGCADGGGATSVLPLNVFFVGMPRPAHGTRIQDVMPRVQCHRITSPPILRYHSATCINTINDTSQSSHVILHVRCLILYLTCAQVNYFACRMSHVVSDMCTGQLWCLTCRMPHALSCIMHVTCSI